MKAVDRLLSRSTKVLAETIWSMYKSDEIDLSMLSELHAEDCFTPEETSFKSRELDFSFITLPCLSENSIQEKSVKMARKILPKTPTLECIESIQLSDLIEFGRQDSKGDLDTPPVLFPKASFSGSLLDPTIEDSYNLKEFNLGDDFTPSPSMLKVEKSPSTDSQDEAVDQLNQSLIYHQQQQQQVIVPREHQWSVKDEEFFYLTEHQLKSAVANIKGEQLKIDSVCGQDQQSFEVIDVNSLGETSVNSVLPVAVEEEIANEELVEDNINITDYSTVITISPEDLKALTGYIQSPQQQTTPTSPDDISLVPSITPPVHFTPHLVTQTTKRSDTAARSTYKASPASSRSSKSAKQKRISDLDKESREYRDRRDRNNESVRKSRDKARQRQEETEQRLEQLSDENKALQDKVDSLEKELSILRGLFTNVGASLPKEVESYQGTPARKRR